MCEHKNINMLYQWMTLNGPKIDCHELHPSTSCINQILTKSYKVMLVSSKFYIFLHLIPFLIFKFKKLKRQKRLTSGFAKLFKKYLGSLLFMSTFVGGSKLMLCILNHTFKKYDLRLSSFMSFATALSILFEEGGRSEEIVYSTLVRAIRSTYIYLKRRGYMSIIYQQQIAFMGLFGLLSYLYHHHPSLLKNLYIFQSIWGNA